MNFSLPTIAFLQATGLVIYCGLVSLLMWNSNDWFGPMTAPLGPILLLTLFVTSALISALVVLGYSFVLFWIEKKPRQALKLVALTTGWLTALVLLFILILIAI